jgi:hypothetical protein
MENIIVDIIAGKDKLDTLAPWVGSDRWGSSLKFNVLTGVREALTGKGMFAMYQS